MLFLFPIFRLFFVGISVIFAASRLFFSRVLFACLGGIFAALSSCFALHVHFLCVNQIAEFRLFSAIFGYFCRFLADFDRFSAI